MGFLQSLWVIFLSLSTLVCAPLYANDENTCSQKLKRVAIHFGPGVARSSAEQIYKILKSNSEKFRIHFLSNHKVVQDLPSFDAVIFAGGAATDQFESLGPEGQEAVREFVRKGGGYLGICAGAYLAAEEPKAYGLGLAQVRVSDPENWNRGTGSVVLKSAQSDLFRMYYMNGPLLEALDSQDGNLLAEAHFTPEFDLRNSGITAPIAGKIALLFTSYGKGRVYLYSTHPEFSEGFEKHLVKKVLLVAGSTCF